MSEYSQGIMADGPVILKDGQPLTPDEIVAELTELEQQLAAIPEDLGKCGQDLWDCADKLNKANKLLDECEEYFAWLHDGEQIVEPIFASEVLLTKLQEREK